jgi:hypothetical protein
VPTRSASIRASSSASSRSSASMRCASEDSDALVAAGTGSGDRVGRRRDPSATRAGTERPSRRQRSCSGAL